MRISATDLAREVDQARKAWPFLAAIEGAHGLPPGLLLAVGSRETNLTDETGDGGHGHGPWQKDDRYAVGGVIARIDSHDVEYAAEVAAGQLADLLAYFHGNLTAALCAYNAGAGAVARALKAGHDPNSVTTGHDYGADVLERLAHITPAAPPPPPPAEWFLPDNTKDDDVPLAFPVTDPTSGRLIVVRQSDGATYSDAGAPAIPGLNAHPEYNTNRPTAHVVGAAPWLDSAGQWGLSIAVLDQADNGTIHFYHFDRKGNPA